MDEEVNETKFAVAGWVVDWVVEVVIGPVVAIVGQLLSVEVIAVISDEIEGTVEVLAVEVSECDFVENEFKV